MKGASILFALLFGCAASQNSPEQRFSSLQLSAKSLCAVLADPKPHVGQRITIKGLYVREPHQRLLFDRDCPEWEFRVSHSLEVDGDRAAERIIERAARSDPTVRVPVVYSGILSSRLVVTGCTAPSCYSYSLNEAQLLAASPQRQTPAAK